MEPLAQQINDLALQHAAQHVTDPGWKRIRMWFTDPRIAPDFVVDVSRSGSGFLGRGAPKQDSPPDLIEIMGTFAPGVLHAQPVRFELAIDKPVSAPKLSYLLATPEVPPDQDIGEMFNLDQVGPFMMQMLSAAPTGTE